MEDSNVNNGEKTDLNEEIKDGVHDTTGKDANERSNVSASDNTVTVDAPGTLENAPEEPQTKNLTQSAMNDIHPEALGSLAQKDGDNNDSSTASADPNSKEKTSPDKQGAYIAPIENPFEKAWKFLYKHDILALFQGLTANIVSEKPTDPFEFMIQEIEDIREQERIRRGIFTVTSDSFEKKIEGDGNFTIEETESIEKSS